MTVDYIKCGDSAVLMQELPDECIDLTVTSPPYDNLRTYNGYSFDFETIAKQLFRITKQGGVVVWIVADATENGSETGTSFRQALFFKECGFNLHDTEIYAKVNPIPQTHNRYEQCFEYMFVFSKGRPKTFNPIRETTKNAGKALAWGHRAILDKKQCRRHRDSDDVQIVNDSKIRTNIFFYTVGGGTTGHPAVFPKQLAIDNILSWSNEKDIVFDPFLGSGTTALCARELNRHFIGFEISEEYFEATNKRIEVAQNQKMIWDYM